MTEKSWLIPMFKAIDSKDTAQFMTFLDSACLFRFGNSPSVQGKENIKIAINQFFESIASVSHSITDAWDIPGGIVCHGEVSYTRKDGIYLMLPFANILLGADKNITNYLVFVDTSNLF